MKSADKVVLNTAILYGRMVLTIGITLYSTRVVLNALGVTDYGIYNLISGMITMLSFLNTAMAASTQRYLSFHEGKNDPVMQKKVFTNSLALHIVIGLILMIALEVTGLFLFHGFLNIPPNKIYSAEIIYHLMSITVFFTIVAVPFNGTLVAHENMLYGAIVNIVETLLKLLIALLLLVVAGNKLIIYGSLTEGVAMVSLILYAVYCFRKYPECTLKNIRSNIDLSLAKDLTSFAGWNLFGSLCFVGRTQGIAVILNVFFGAFINAAYAIANQVMSQINFFSATMLRALNPQIMKSEGSGDRKRMLRLSMIASKFGFFLLATFAIPAMFEMKPILTFWLKNVPDYTVIFCNLILITSLINQLTVGLQSAIQATGKIKVYQAVVGSIILLNLPIAYILLKMHFSAPDVILSFLFVETTACIFRLLIVKKIAGLSIKEYCERVFLRELGPLIIIIAVCYASTNFLHMHFRFYITFTAALIMFPASIALFGLNTDERDILKRMITSVSSKFLKTSQPS